MFVLFCESQGYLKECVNYPSYFSIYHLEFELLGNLLLQNYICCRILTVLIHFKLNQNIGAFAGGDGELMGLPKKPGWT